MEISYIHGPQNEDRINVQARGQEVAERKKQGSHMLPPPSQSRQKAESEDVRKQSEVFMADRNRAEVIIIPHSFGIRIHL